MFKREFGVPVSESHKPSGSQSYDKEDGRRCNNVHQMDSPE